MEAGKLFHELLDSVASGERLCLLPLARVLVAEPGWISEETAIFPSEALNGELLRTVSWPEHDFQKFFGSKDGVVTLEGDDLHWAKSAATRIDLPAFFGSALLGLPIEIDWDAFLTPASHEAHLEMLGAAMDKAERTMDLMRFERCKVWIPGMLPGRAGLLGDTGICAGLFYAPEDHESYIIAGQVLTHQVIAGIGLDLTGTPMLRLPGAGEVGAVARHALRLYSEALEAATETSRFVQLISLIEFLAAPQDFVPMKRAKRLIARQIARDRADYDAILQDFLYLTSEGGSAKGPKRGLRHNIVHLGKRLEELADAAEREAIFRRLARYAGVTIEQLLRHGAEDWATIEALRAAGITRLGLVGEEAT